MVLRKSGTGKLQEEVEVLRVELPRQRWAETSRKARSDLQDKVTRLEAQGEAEESEQAGIVRELRMRLPAQSRTPKVGND